MTGKFEQYREDLRRQLHQSRALADLQEHEGFKLYVRLLEEYRERSYAEWLRGERDSEEYRVECQFLDWLDGCLDAFRQSGQDAAARLEGMGDDG